MPTAVQIGAATLYNADWRDVVDDAWCVDAVVTDPPYGIGADQNTRANTQRGAAGAPSRDYGKGDWDAEPPSEGDFSRLLRLASWHIIYGGNYFHLPPSSCWLVWDKENGNNGYADCELAWTNLPKAVRRIKFMWNGMLRQNGESRGDHPTQKPIEVMRWSIGHLPKGVATILDPYMGSGTTGVAATSLGFKFFGIEREPKYFDIACNRIEQAQRQSDLFIKAPEIA